MAMITEIETYFTRGCGRCARFGTPDCTVTQHADAVAGLREVCLAAGLTETLKWGHPCYMHAGRNVALIGAVQDGAVLSFFHPALMSDPDGLLERQGPNTPHPNVIRFADGAAFAARRVALGRYLREAMDHAAAGRVQKEVPRAVELPAEMVEALDADPEIAEAFHALTPGRQRSYAIALSSAKKTETRVARIAKFRDHILAGKGATER